MAESKVAFDITSHVHVRRLLDQIVGNIRSMHDQMQGLDRKYSQLLKGDTPGVLEVFQFALEQPDARHAATLAIANAAEEYIDATTLETTADGKTGDSNDNDDAGTTVPKGREHL